jgi:MFS family permease
MVDHGKPSRVGIDLSEFKRSWRILVLAMLGVGINANSAMLYAFGPLVLPLQQHFGWSRGDLQLAMSFLFGGAVLSAQAAGWLNLHFGMRRVTVVSLLALTVAFAGMTQLQGSIHGLYLGLFILPLASLGTMQVTWTQLVNLWFVQNRGLALAIVLSGTGLAAALLPPMVAWSVERWGWQAAFVLLALVPTLVVLPLALRWMKLPDVVAMPAALAAASASAQSQHTPATTLLTAGATFGQTVASVRFWCLNVGLVLVVAGVVGMVTATVPLLRDKGLTGPQAAQIFGGFGLSLIVGRAFVGYLVDRLWAPGVAAVSLSLPALGCLLLLYVPASDTGWLTVATMLIGAGAGAEFDVAAYLVARYYGLRDYGRIFGLHLGLITAGSALSPALFGLLYSSTGSYTSMLWICTAMFLLGPQLILLLGPYPKNDATAS